LSTYTLHVVSHTHWDREWYLPFQLFRLRLVDLVDRLLDLLDRDSEFKYFHLDGQTIILDDYLEVKPQNEARLREYVRQGRILIGPWYQQNDQFLTSGESTVRNLLLGMRDAGEFGGTMMVGYCPDTFGNISQLPQILQGFGIDSAVFGRGFTAGRHPKSQFLWESPDASRVLSVQMSHWYNNAEHIPADPEAAIKLLEKLKDGMGPKAAVPHLLLMNGSDHLEAQEDLSTAIRLANEQLGEDTLVHTTLPACIEAVKRDITEAELEIFTGEMREDDGGHVLAGTLSTRMNLKQANHASQTWLEKCAEPACSCAWMMGAEYPSGALTYAWKLLMQNHTHDAICGCGMDPTHEDMLPRFRQVDQVAKDLTERALESLAERVQTDSDSLLVFNPLAWNRTDKVRAIVDFPLGEESGGEPPLDPERKVGWLEIRDAAGEIVPFAVLDSRATCKLVRHPHRSPTLQWVKRFTIEFIAGGVPSCGYKIYRIASLKSKPARVCPPTLYSDNAMSNGLVRVRFGEEGITVERLAADGETALETYTGLNVFEDCGDIGDEYIHRKPERDVVVKSSASRFSLVAQDAVSATVRLQQTLLLPAAASRDRKGRSKRMVRCPITTYVTITRGIPRVDFRVEVDNRSKDHRLRVVFPTRIKTDVSHAEGQFDVLTRPIAVPPEWNNASTARPQQSWVDVNDGKRGFCLINKGLPEYELYEDENSTLALTLLRCVSAMTGGAEALVHSTPGAQMIGKHAFEYSVYPHFGGWAEAQTWRQAQQFNAPLSTMQTSAHEGDLPGEMSFLAVEPAQLVVTAIKKADGEDRLMVRFFNTTDAAVAGKVTVSGARVAELANLNEQIQESLEIAADGSVELDAAGKRIVTLAFGLASSH
jgi:alpha-mannosidase